MFVPVAICGEISYLH